MKKSLQITQVKCIINIAKPVIVLEVAGHPALLRTPHQFVTDMQGSGRLLDLDPTDFKDFEYTDAVSKADMQECAYALVGAEVTGDINEYKAGDTYIVTATSDAITNKSNPNFGRVVVGDPLQAEKDGVRIEGFLFVPKTAEERLDDKIAESYAKKLYLRKFGNVKAPVAQRTTEDNPFATTTIVEDVNETPEVATSKALMGEDVDNAKTTKVK